MCVLSQSPCLSGSLPSCFTLHCHSWALYNVLGGSSSRKCMQHSPTHPRACIPLSMSPSGGLYTACPPVGAYTQMEPRDLECCQEWRGLTENRICSDFQPLEEEGEDGNLALVALGHLLPETCFPGCCVPRLSWFSFSVFFAKASSKCWHFCWGQACSLLFSSLISVLSLDKPSMSVA